MVVFGSFGICCWMTETCGIAIRERFNSIGVHPSRGGVDAVECATK